LAQADEEAVLHLWQGLGYYSRARNMHYAAKQILNEYQGFFPNQYEQIIKLKGVGDYTAAAIASIAFQLPYPAVDGNVLRVIARIFGFTEDIRLEKTRKKIKQKCQTLMENTAPGDFNQAMMEFGAIQCKPQNPRCEECPFTDYCYAFLHQQVSILPVKINKVKMKTRYFHYFIFVENGQLLIHQRIKKDIWQHLYQYPLIETEHPTVFPTEEFSTFWQLTPVDGKFIYETKHQLTHQLLIIRFYIFNRFPKKKDSSYITISIEHHKNYPFPVVIGEFNQWLEYPH
jgi:A/G-specific adenine glycosylase